MNQKAQFSSSGPGCISEEQYFALRTGAGAIWIEREFLEVSGPDTLKFLQGQCSQNIDAIEVGQSADSLLLEPDGKLCALIRLTRLKDDQVIIDTARGYKDKVEHRLARFKLRTKVEFKTLDWHCVGLRGNKVAQLSELNHLEGVDVLVIDFDWNNWKGVDLIGPSVQLLESVEVAPNIQIHDVEICSFEAGQSCRIESGIPLMGAELTEKTIPGEAHLVERTVSFSKGCYTGQELIARLDARGNRVARRLVGIVIDESDHVAVPSVGSQLISGPDSKVVGVLTSLSWSPSLGCPVALGYLHRSIEIPNRLEIKSLDDTRIFAAEARVLPLV